VHHGGIGTLAQALRAGVPQLVTPMNFDQPDNAMRLARLGVSRSLRLTRYTAPAAAQKLSELLESTEVAARCRAVARRFAGLQALEDTCWFIESARPSTVAGNGAA
jgi:UDP:flavonoid glycosyltransferase YjiC (YdhE family)